MSQDILITPGSGEPQILFRGSGTTDTAVELNVLSSYQSATGSGTALLFEGEEGLLFGVTDNLSSGTIFSVSDISGLTAIEYDASGDLKLGEYANSTTLYADRGVYLATGIPTNTTNAVYISGGALHFNGSTVGGSYTAGSGLTLVGTEFNTAGTGNFNQLLFTDENLKIGTDSHSISSGISIGYQAGSGYTGTGADHIFIGTNAGSESWSASSRAVCIGYNAGRNAFVDHGAIIGEEAGRNQYGTNSVYIGKQAGYAGAWQSSHNSFNSIGIGTLALVYCQGATNSIALGSSAGRSMTGDNNFVVGAEAGYNITGDNNIELRMGKSGTSIIGSNSDKLHIQETIIGDTSSKLLAIGNVGSADLTPDATLEIKPNAATDVGLIVQGATSQSADFVQFQTSSETVTSKIDSAGRLLFDIDTITTTPSTKGVGAYAKGVAVFDDNDGSMMAYFLRDGTDNYTRFNSNDVRLFAASASTNGVHLKSANTSFGTPTDGLAIYDNDGTTLGELKCDFVNVDINSSSANGQKITAAASQTAELQIWENSSSTKLVAVGPDGGLELPNNVPSTTTNKLYNNAGTLTFNGSALGGGGISNIVEDTTPQLGGTLDANGNTIDMGTYVITDTKVGQWDTAYGWGDHGSAGYLTTHPTISAASSSDNSGRTYIQDIILDSNGHVTGLATATETVTDTTYTAGTGLTLSSTTFNANVNATTQTVAANTVSATSSRTYAVQVNASDELVVNVPWTDTDTNTQLSQEQVEDFAGNLIATGGTKTGITVTYQDSTNDVDFVVGGLTTTEIAAATLVTSAEGIGSNNNDTTIPTSAAVKAYADSVGGGGGGAVSAVANGADNRIATFSSTDALNGEANLTFDGSTLAVNGAFTATTKSFLIDHPSKEGMKLQYASLEGPENGVYVRGTTKDTFITLPNYWRDLVHNSSITVTLTPVGSFQPLFVESKSNREIIVGGVCGYYDYVVWGERKDVEKLEVEW
jgi:hypothetical protein